MKIGIVRSERSFGIIFLAPMPVGISCSASNSSIDVTWQAPDAECPITGFDVTWNYNILWSNNDSKPGSKLLGVESSYSIVEDIIPYTEYFVQVTTLVLDQRGNESALCSVETPQERKFRKH